MVLCSFVNTFRLIFACGCDTIFLLNFTENFMATLLLIFIYIIYIGLGVPDSSLGSALPAMWESLNLPVSLGSVVSIIISLFTIVSSLLSARLINKFGAGLVVAISTLISALGLLGFALSNSFLLVALSAIPLGFGAGAIDAALNGYVAQRYSPLKVNILHCFYGIGVAITPFIFSFTLKDANNWRLGYFIVFGIQLFLSALSFCLLPLWKKTNEREQNLQELSPVNLSYIKMVKTPSIRAIMAVFFFSCALEFTCNTWGTTFLTAHGLSEATSAGLITLYFIGMTVGRFGAGFLTIKLSLYKLLSITYSFVFVAIILLFLPISPVVKGVAFFFIGLGNGPTFPNLTVATANWYGKCYSQSLVSCQMVFSCLGILIMPALLGVILDAFEREITTIIFPIFIGILFALMVLYTALFYFRPKKVYEDKSLQK